MGHRAVPWAEMGFIKKPTPGDAVGAAGPPECVEPTQTRVGSPPPSATLPGPVRSESLSSPALQDLGKFGGGNRMESL